MFHTLKTMLFLSVYVTTIGRMGFQFPPPLPWNENRQKQHCFQCMEPSDLNNGRNDPISYTMIVSVGLKSCLAFLDFFDSYHALAMP